MPLDVTARLPRRAPSLETQREIDRVQALWADCRARYGEGGPFLFGRFSIADAMFAPVACRFRTYDVPILDDAASFYEAVLALPEMKEWERAAEAEVRDAATRPRPRAPDPTNATQYFAVIFTSQHASGAPEGYEETAAAMVELAQKQPGFLGIESARSEDGFGITVSYWQSLHAITSFKAEAAHQQAQRNGRELFYSRYQIRIASVERGYRYPPSPSIPLHR
jgi:heme-degrading monooxygenase HmoA